jgi:hypothetical protein
MAAARAVFNQHCRARADRTRLADVTLTLVLDIGWCFAIFVTRASGAAANTPHPD